MTKIGSSVLVAAAALVVTACAGIPPAAPTTEALVTLEKSANEAWKSKDAAFWDTFLSDAFVGYGMSGRLDKASGVKELTGADCEIRSYALSDERMTRLAQGAALLTYTSTVDGTCGGQAVPARSRAASVYVRDGDRWKAAFHAEAPIVNPQAAPATPVGKEGAIAGSAARPAGAGTEAMLAVEKALWEAWRAHDAKAIDDLTTPEISFVNIFGTYFANKADALKDWTGPGCDVKSVSVTDAAGTMLSPTVGILTFTGGADGTCYGQKVGSAWGTSIYVKEGDAWKWTFGINLPAPESARSVE